jgi:hypothetical protein
MPFVNGQPEEQHMTTTPDTIDHNTLARLVEAGAVRGADVIGQSGGWEVVIKYGMTERALAARRGAVRIFKKFETLVGYLKGLGIAEYRVNAANFDPSALKSHQARPDAAARMKRAHDAAAYDTWFRAQVQESLDDLRPSIPHEEVLAEWHTERAELLRDAGKPG